jgi:hypothetical protein
MVQTEAATVRNQIVVEGPSSVPSRCSRIGSGTSIRPSTICSERQLPGQRSSPGSVAASSTGHRMAGKCRWARILAFDPPDRVMVSWDISAQWTIETDPAQTSEVESASTPSPRTAPGLSWSTGTSTGMVSDGKRSLAVSMGCRAGRCTWTATLHCSPKVADARRHLLNGSPR